MKKFGSKAGFTLVELIVVIAILGILAGVAVPAYSAYIKKANDAAVLTELDAVKTAAIASNATNTVEVDKINVSNAGVVTVTLKTGGTLATNYYATFQTLHGNATATANTSVTITGLSTKMAATDTYKNGAEWTSTGWKGVTTG